jgi:Leucine-rich repeat (LRR) protein
MTSQISSNYLVPEAKIISSLEPSIFVSSLNGKIYSKAEQFGGSGAHACFCSILSKILQVVSCIFKALFSCCASSPQPKKIPNRVAQPVADTKPIPVPLSEAPVVVKPTSVQSDKEDKEIARSLGLDEWKSEGDIASAKMRIVKCFRNQEVRLNLAGLRLSSLPAALGKLTRLEEFNCAQNQLTALPLEIGQLTELKILSCNSNQLGSLPPQIEKFTKLEQLDCSVNHFAKLPVKITCLTSLRFLHCTHNQITELPEQIRELKQLKTLDCSNNRLEALPPEIGLLGNLVKLNCSFNKLTELPGKIGALSQLQILDCSHNKLGRLPEEIKHLAHLQELDLTDNQLEELPTELPKTLIKLNCSYNKFTELPTELSVLNPDTAVLNFCGNSISWLPPELSHFNINVSMQFINREGKVESRSLGVFKQAVSREQKDLKRLKIPNLREDERLWTDLSLWLDKLAATPDFKNEKTKSVTAERILSVLKLAEENEAYRETLKAVLTEALQSCTDRATLPLCALEIQKAILESKNGSLEGMLKVLKGAFVAELLQGYAREFMLTHPRADEVEVYLGFQLLFKEEFNLPIGIQDMNHLRCADIENTDIDAARNKVYEGLQNRERLVNSLLGQPVWIEKLKAEFSSEWNEILEALTEEMNKAGEEDNSFIKITAINERFKVTQAEWLKAKTEQVVS